MPLRTIADQWSVSKTSLIRHRDRHIPVALTAAQAAAEVVQGNNLLAQVHEVLERAKVIVDHAQLEGDLRAATSALREVRGAIELLAKLAGALQDKPQVNVVITPEWHAMRATLVQALDPYPDAKHAVVDLVLNSKEASESRPSA